MTTRQPGDGHDHSWAEGVEEARACCPDLNPGLAGTGIRCPGASGGLPLADGTIQALAHLLAGTLRAGRPEAEGLVRRAARDLAEGLGIDQDATLAEVEASLRTALGMPAREGLPDCDRCGTSLGITADGLCTSCAATVMLGTILHPEQGLEDDDEDDDDWDGEEDYEDE